MTDSVTPRKRRGPQHRMRDVHVKSLTGICSICGPVDVKPVRNKQCKGGVHYRCARAYASGQRLTIDNRKGSRGHGLTGAQVAAYLAGRVCRICGSDEWLNVDHDHKTGRLRGALCGNHNRALGLFEDNELHLARAILYLRGELPDERSTAVVPGDHFWGFNVRDHRQQWRAPSTY